MFVTSAGSPQARFDRAIRAGNATVALAAAAELPRVSLANALSLVLVVLTGDRARFPRLATRWHALLLNEARGMTVDEAALSLAALDALRGSSPVAGARALLALLEAHQLTSAADVLRDWLEARPG